MVWFFRKATDEEKRKLLGEIKKKLKGIAQMRPPKLSIGLSYEQKNFDDLFLLRLDDAQDKFNTLYKNVPREERTQLAPLSHMLELMSKQFKAGSYSNIGKLVVDALAEIDHLVNEVYTLKSP